MNKKSKINSILWAIGYFVVTMCIVVSVCILFHNNYFALIYVDGSSMTPTLNNNGVVEFGIVDEHSSAINNLKRFDIITTYYPVKYHGSNGYTSDYVYINENGQEVATTYDDPDHEVKVAKNADFKIKRIMALPGESFKVTSDGVQVRALTEDNTWGEVTTYKFPFEHKSGDKTDLTFTTLKDDEYWVLGDNWGGSIDCKALNCPIKKGNIQGKLVAIEGTCKVTVKNGKVTITNKKYYSGFRYF